MRVSVEPSGPPVACAFCHAADAALVPCQGCGTHLHRECWREIARCTTSGCTSGPERVTEPEGSLVCVACRGGSAGVALVRCERCGAHAHGECWRARDRRCPAAACAGEPAPEPGVQCVSCLRPLGPGELLACASCQVRPDDLRTPETDRLEAEARQREERQEARRARTRQHLARLRRFWGWTWPKSVMLTYRTRDGRRLRERVDLRSLVTHPLWVAAWVFIGLAFGLFAAVKFL